MFTRNDFEVVRAKSEKWIFDDIYKPHFIGVTDNYVIVSDRATSKHLHLISKEDLRYLGSFGSYGDGPDEFLSFSNFTTTFEKDQVNFYSGNDRKLVFFSLKEGLTKEEVPLLSPDSILRIAEISTDYLHVNMLSRDLMVAKLINSDDRFVIQSLSSGKILEKYDSWEGMLKEKDIPNSILASVFQGKVAVSPNTQYFGHATVLWDFIEVYDTVNDTWLRLSGPDRLEHVFSISTSIGYPMHSYDTEKNRLGYIQLALGNNFIYALYGGQKITHNPYPTKLLIFNYDGDPIKAYELDVVPSYGMAIDDENNMVYLSITENDNGGIARFPLDLP